MKKFVLATVCTVALVGFVMADEFPALITGISGDTVSYYKTKAPMKGAGKGGKGAGKAGGFGKAPEKDGDLQKATVSSSLKVVKGKFNADTKMIEAGDPIEGGLKADMFSKIDPDVGVVVTLTTGDTGADKGKITQIRTGFGGGKGGGFKGGKGGAAKGGGQ